MIPVPLVLKDRMTCPQPLVGESLPTGHAGAHTHAHRDVQACTSLWNLASHMRRRFCDLYSGSALNLDSVSQLNINFETESDLIPDLEPLS